MRPFTRLIAWPAALALAWFVGPTLTAGVYLEQLLRSASGLPGTLGEHLSAAAQVWRLASSPELRPLTPWVLAVVVAAGVTAWRQHRDAGGQ